MNLREMDDNKLEQLYKHCLAAIIEDKPNRPRAEALIDDINEVWQQRLQSVSSAGYKAETPEVGVLKTVGYGVGASGLSTQQRWALLDQVMSGVLPFVGSPAHMLEWGEPNSRTRYRKLHRVIAGFRTSAKNQEWRVKAFKEWSEDLDYIEREWKTKVDRSRE